MNSPEQDSQLHQKIFKKGSKTYYNSSLFFPKKLRREVFELYAFVRIADDFVDAIPQKDKEFHAFADLYRRALAGEPTQDPVIAPFISLLKKRDFDPQWVEAFLKSMELDLVKREYNSEEEILDYIYGSAEVIGLFMSRLMQLPPEASEAAKMLGRSMQYINFIRDIREDNELGRRYLPLMKTPLQNLSQQEAFNKPEQFCEFLRGHTRLYQEYSRRATLGFYYIPRRYLPPIKTAMDMYNWTAAQIMKDPLIVFQKKVKPSKLHILFTLFKNLFYWAPKP